MVRIGVVSSSDPATATVRVAFDDKGGVVSYDLPVLQRQTLQNKDYAVPEPGEHVVCLFMPNGNAQGFCLGAFYSDVDTPKEESLDVRAVEFSDGTRIAYDRSSHTLTIDCVGNIVIRGARIYLN